VCSSSIKIIEFDDFVKGISLIRFYQINLAGFLSSVRHAENDFPQHFYPVRPVSRGMEASRIA
jgi:hypothetical protein